MISILVPFRANGPRDTRIKAWKWVEQKWRALLPDAELVVGTDTGGDPFSKSVAVNDAYSKSHGDMLVIADADSWVMKGPLDIAIQQAARQEHLVVPWFTAYRLTKEDSNSVMATDPAATLSPVTREMRERAAGTGPSPASAAMALVIQRRSFERVGGWDPRFRGWGSEDVSFGNACWTLLGRNEYCIGEAYALYHPQPTNKEGFRVWKGEDSWGNKGIYERYRKAQGRPTLMTAVCREHPLAGATTAIGPSPTLNMDDMVSLPEMDVENPPEGPVAHEPQFIQPDDRIQI